MKDSVLALSLAAQGQKQKYRPAYVGGSAKEYFVMALNLPCSPARRALGERLQMADACG
jgi:hypothetical protein